MSKIEVNTVDTQTGTNLTVGAACKSVTVAGNDVRSNAYKAADGGNIASQSGTTITLGASGDTITLASGASQSGFGREGSVDWQTGSIKTSTFTAASGEGYFCNTSGGAFTVNLPAGSAGAIVAIADYTRTFQTNNLTVTPNGSEKIGGQGGNSVLSTEGQAVTLVYVDGTEGWINVQETSNSIQGETYMAATGGTVTTSGNFKIHTFTGPGTFCVSSISNTPANNEVSYVVVAGGGGTGSRWHAGGGGAGGFRERKSGIDTYTASPLNGATPISVTATGFPITVGAGGAGATPADPTNRPGNSGNPSTFSSITSTAGGKGGTFNEAGASGGSGGASGANPGSLAGGSGNTPPVSPPQGRSGGNGRPGSGGGAGGGGGGAGAVGSNTPAEYAAGAGGNGVTTCIPGSPTALAGGGAGATGSENGVCAGTPAAGGTGGGANTGADAVANKGGGGGGPATTAGAGGNGGSGIVIIRYKFQ